MKTCDITRYVKQTHNSQYRYEVNPIMHIEFRHLRTIRAIHDAGGLARAAEVLNITQSALSHQVKGLEDQVGVELFVRRTKPLKLSAAGHRLLKLADKVLPELEALEVEFEGLRKGKSGRLHIAIECHACFEWLFPVLEEFRKAWPDVDVDIRPGLAFKAVAIEQGLPLVRLSESSGFYMRQGQPVLVPNAPCDGMVRVALDSGEFLGIGEILDDGRVAPRRLIVTGR